MNDALPLTDPGVRMREKGVLMNPCFHSMKKSAALVRLAHREETIIEWLFVFIPEN